MSRRNPRKGRKSGSSERRAKLVREVVEAATELYRRRLWLDVANEECVGIWVPGEEDLILLRVVDPEAVAPAIPQAIESVPGVQRVTVSGRGIEVTVEEAPEVLGAVVAAASAEDLAITGIEVREPNLESVFLDLTGRALRD